MADVPAQAEVQQASPEDRLAAFMSGSLPATRAQPAPAQEAAQPEDQDAVDTPVDETEEDVAVAPDEQAAPEEAFDELEHLGKTYEVPVSLKKAFEENRSLATKSAQSAKAAETLAAQLHIKAQLLDAETQFNRYAESEITEKARLEGVLGQYKKLDWYGMAPEQYAENRRNRDILAEQLEDVKSTLSKKRGEYDGWRMQQGREVLNRGVEYLQKVIPNFQADETRSRIAQTAKGLGYTDEEVGNLHDPRLVVALHKAAQWDRLQANKPQATNKAGKAPPVARSGSNVSANNAAVAKQNALRARVKKSGDLKDVAALLETRLR